MFNFRKNNVERKYKGNKIYVLKYDDLPIEQILNIIVKNIEAYTKSEGKMPDKLRISYETYERILSHNKTLIEKRNGKYFTFGVEIEV